MRCRSLCLEDKWKLSMHMNPSSDEIYPSSILRSLCLSFHVFSTRFEVSNNQLIAVLHQLHAPHTFTITATPALCDEKVEKDAVCAVYTKNENKVE